jgi:hypothetical protein
VLTEYDGGYAGLFAYTRVADETVWIRRLGHGPASTRRMHIRAFRVIHASNSMLFTVPVCL